MMKQRGGGVHDHLFELHQLHLSIQNRYRQLRSGLKDLSEEHGELDESLTVGFTLIFLITNSTHQIGDTLSSIDSYSNGFVVVAKKTRKLGVCIIVTCVLGCMVTIYVPRGIFTLGAPGFREDFLRFPIISL
jgi:hypothetical protein